MALSPGCVGALLGAGLGSLGRVSAFSRRAGGMVPVWLFALAAGSVTGFAGLYVAGALLLADKLGDTKGSQPIFWLVAGGVTCGALGGLFATRMLTTRSSPNG